MVYFHFSAYLHIYYYVSYSVGKYYSGVTIPKGRVMRVACETDIPHTEAFKSIPLCICFFQEPRRSLDVVDKRFMMYSMQYLQISLIHPTYIAVSTVRIKLVRTLEEYSIFMHRQYAHGWGVQEVFHPIRVSRT